MSVTVTLRGVNYTLAQDGDQDYGAYMSQLINAMVNEVNNTPLSTNTIQYDAVVSSNATRRTHATLEAVIADAAVLAGSNVLIDGEMFEQNATLDISKKLYIFGIGNSGFEAGAGLGANPVVQFSASGSLLYNIAIDANGNAPTYAIQVDAGVMGLGIDVETIGAFATGDLDNNSTDEAVIGGIRNIAGNYLLPISLVGANSELSNLASPTAINEDLVYDTDNTYDVGSDAIEAKTVWAYGIKHNDAVDTDLEIETTGNDGDIKITPHGTGIVILDSTVEVESGRIEETAGDLEISAANDIDIEAVNDVNIIADNDINLVSDNETYTLDYGGDKASIVSGVEIQDYTVVGSVGDSNQQFAGHTIVEDDFATAASLIAVYNLADNTDETANANTLDDGDAYNAGNGILNVATTAYVPAGAGEHLQADATAGWSGDGDLDVSMGGWFKLAAGGASAGLMAVGTNATDQKMQFYTNATGYVVFDIAGVTGMSSSYIGDSSWHRVDFVYDQTNSIAYGYVDGKCETTISATTNLDLQANKSIWIGCKTDGTLELATTYCDECYVYEAVATQAEIDKIYGTEISLPAALQGKDFSCEAFMKPSVAGSTTQVWCDEVARESDRILISGGTRRSTDYYRLLGKV